MADDEKSGNKEQKETFSVEQNRMANYNIFLLQLIKYNKTFFLNDRKLERHAVKHIRITETDRAQHTVELTKYDSQNKTNSTIVLPQQNKT